MYITLTTHRQIFLASSSLHQNKRKQQHKMKTFQGQVRMYTRMFLTNTTIYSKRASASRIQNRYLSVHESKQLNEVLA